MSSQDQGQGDDRPNPDRRQSFTKLVMNKAKSALKRDKSKRTLSSDDVPGQSGPNSPTSPSSIPIPVRGKESSGGKGAATSPGGGKDKVLPTVLPLIDTQEAFGSMAGPAFEKQTAEKTPQPPAEKKEVTKSDTKGAADTNVDSRAAALAALRQQRVMALFEKHNMILEPHEWPVPYTSGKVERVQKSIRMRVHRRCHRCQTTFGVEKTCEECGHNRCKKCPRYPVKKPKHAQDTQKTEEKPGKPSGKGKHAYMIPAKTEQQDRVRKVPRQRVRRTCLICQTDFAKGEKTCSKCAHVRCTRCPREPAKLNKYPNGYPGDVQPPELELLVDGKRRMFKKARMRVKWRCHVCDTFYLHGLKTCASCQHERCNDCTREPPKKVKRQPDADLVKSVEARLAAMNITD